MTAFHQALYAFWNQFSLNGAHVSAYIKGRVPETATFPYITYEAVMGTFGGFTPTSAVCWHKEENGKNVMLERAQLLDVIAQAIPVAGAYLDWDGGGAVLRRSPSDFLSYYDVETDAQEKPDGLPVLGGRIGYEIDFYNV